MKKYIRCLWIVHTLMEEGDASLADLNERWKRSSYGYEGEEIGARTFSRDKEFIASVMQVDIEYDSVTRKYTLVNKDDVEKNTIYKYLLSVFHINGISSLSIRLKDRMMLEEIPTGVEYLPVLLKAMEEEKVVKFDYQSYYSKESLFHFEVIPCFLRLFKQRWYLICEYLDRSRTRVLALERMQNLVAGNKKSLLLRISFRKFIIITTTGLSILRKEL